MEKIKDSLLKAIQGLSKPVEMLKREVMDARTLKGEDVLELESVLRRLSDALSKRIEQIASEIYAF